MKHWSSQILCNFLSAGYTHKDIHAFFGALAQFIKLRDRYDIEGMSLSFYGTVRHVMRLVHPGVPV